QRRMAREFGGDANAIRDRSVELAARALRINLRSWKEAELKALENLSLVMATRGALSDWDAVQRNLAAEIVRAKAGAEESRYLKLMQKHAALRDVFMRLGCGVHP